MPAGSASKLDIFSDQMYNTPMRTISAAKFKEQCSWLSHSRRNQERTQ